MADLIDRQAAIGAIIKHLTMLKEDMGYGVIHGNDAVRILESLPSAQPEQRWIPVSERLPEEFDYVLVTIKHKNEKPKTSRARWTKARWIGSGQMTDVTAWMPLPEPYEEE